MTTKKSSNAAHAAKVFTMIRFGKKLSKTKARRKAPVQLSVEALEVRLVPAAHIGSATSLAASAQLSAHAIMASTPTQMRNTDQSPAHLADSGQLSQKSSLSESPAQMKNMDLAAASAHSLAQLSANSPADSAAAKAGNEIVLDNVASSDAAAIDGLLQQYSAAQAAAGKDAIDKLIDWEDQTNPNMQPNVAIQQAEKAMSGLAAALRAAGVSDQDIQHLLGQASGNMPSQAEIANSPFLQSIFDRQDQGSTGWMVQLPFLSVVQGQDPIQNGAPFEMDPRTEVGPHYDPNGKSQGTYGSGDGQFSVWKNPDGTRWVIPPAGGSKETESIGKDQDGREKYILVKDKNGAVVGVVIIPLDKLGQDAKVEPPLVAPKQDQQKSDPPPQPKDAGTSKMPAPDGVGSDEHSGGPIGIPDLGGQVEMRVSEYSRTTNVDKLVGSIVGHINSTVNPNPNAPSGGVDEGSFVPVHQGDPIDDHPLNNSNPHPGGKPTIVFGIGGPGPKVH